MRRLAFFALVALCAPANGQIVETWEAYGMSGETCAEWSADKAEDGWDYTVKHAWVIGIISGYNGARGGDLLSTTNTSAALAWVDDYCARRPADPIIGAARQLIKALVARNVR